MDREKKRTLALGILIILAILAAIIYFFWGNLINRGTLRIFGKEPFTVEVFGISTTECVASPCELNLKSGLKDLIVKKDGYKPIITDATIELWQTADLKLDFEIIPQVVETDAIPVIQKINRYKLVFDKKTKMQKLINAEDKKEIAIAYFQKKLNSPLIIGNNNTILIGSKNGTESYLIDQKIHSREKIDKQNLADIEDGQWSQDGVYLLYKRKNLSHLWLLNSQTKTIQELELTTGLTQTSWIYGNKLAFITDQSYRSTNETEINLTDEKSATGFTLGIYHASENTYEKTGTFPEIVSMPTQFTANDNGQAIYFTTNDKKFKVNLKEF